jgi:hypothetical protein
LIQSSGGIAFHQHASGSRDILFINGTQQAVTSGTAGNITGGTSYFRIGAAEGSAGAYWNGSLCEVLVIASSVSTANRQTIEGYLAHKWGLSSSLPSDHPYKSAPPTV